MPPEPFPWDRKDFYRERKHQNGGYDRASEPFVGSVSRWRDSPSHGSRNDFGRWGYPPECRRPPGHGKQGGWHLYPDDLPHGYSTPRSGDRFYQDGGTFKPSGPYRDGRYNRNFRENRGCFNQKSWRSHSWDYNNQRSMTPSGPGRSYEGKDQKFIDGPSPRISHPYYSDDANTSNQLHSKEQADEPHNESDTSQKIEKENSLASADWKPFNWSRSGSLTSKGSGLSLPGNLKNASESCDVKFELPPKISTPDESSSGDAVGCLASPTSLEDTASRKKPRLGWGEGLAKFEKKIGPDDCQLKNSSMLCTGSMELMPSPTPHLADSPRTSSLLECRSPVTPASAVCTSSPGLDDKSCVKAAEIDSDSYNLSPSPTPRSQNHLEELSLSPKNMEHKSNYNQHELLNELLQNEDQSMVILEFIKTVGVNKLDLFRGEISKALELTESEIDSLENELKSLKSQPGNSCRHPESSSSMPNCQDKPGSKRPPGLMVASSGDIVVEDTVPCRNIIEESHAESKNEYVDSPGTATSKFMESSSSNKFSLHGQQKHVFSGEYEVCTSVEVQTVAGSSAPDSEIKVAKNEHLVVSDSMEESEMHNILASNNETATGASNFLSNLLPCSSYSVQSVEAISARCTPNNLIVKERFLKRKNSLRFKERALCLKYRVLQYQWKEELQLLCERKYGPKSQKKVESGYRSSHGGSQKHRSSIRLRVVSPASNSSLLRKSEVVSFASKLLSDSQIRSYRNDLKMPSLILDKTEKELSMFLSNNGLVEHPYTLEKERALMNPWTAEEKEIFLDKYVTYGKDFKKISSFLDHKTTADCVEFYYKNHKSSLFKNTKQHKLKKQEKSALNTRYLMTSGKKIPSSLDMLGAASAIVAKDNNKEAKSVKMRLNGTVREISRSFSVEDERETEAADALASICCSMSSEATSSYITQNANDETCSDESCGYMEENVDWTDEDKSRFLQAFISYGKDFVLISQCVGTKSRDQCKVFFGKARKCLGLDELLLRRSGGADDVEDDMATCGDGSSGTTDEKDPPVNAPSLNPRDEECLLDKEKELNNLPSLLLGLGVLTQNE
ncbi:hypothetical protein V2J09_008328 [Rumex salicifolius]